MPPLILRYVKGFSTRSVHSSSSVRSIRASSLKHVESRINLEKKDKEKRILEKVEELTKTFEKLNKNTQSIVYPMIQKVAFMSVTLDDLQDDINQNGITERYQNGEHQFGIKKTISVDIYNTMIKNYSALMKQLTELLQKENLVSKEENPLIKFMNE